MARFCFLIATTDFLSKQAIQAACHQRELNIKVDFHGNGRRQSVHVKKIDAILNTIFYNHPFRISLNNLWRRPGKLIGQKKYRIFMS